MGTQNHVYFFFFMKIPHWQILQLNILMKISIPYWYVFNIPSTCWLLFSNKMWVKNFGFHLSSAYIENKVSGVLFDFVVLQFSTWKIYAFRYILQAFTSCCDMERIISRVQLGIYSTKSAEFFNYPHKYWWISLPKILCLILIHAWVIYWTFDIN